MKGGQRPGAGRKPDPQSKRQILRVRVSEQEQNDLRETADHYGLTVSDLVRKALGLDR